MPARPVRVLRREKGRLTRKSGAAYTAPPDAAPKQNGPGRTDFSRFRKVDLAKAKVLDFTSASNYESDYCSLTSWNEEGRRGRRLSLRLGFRPWRE
jgi:hypothetical protein